MLTLSLPVIYLIVLPMVFLGGFMDAAAGGGGLVSMPAYLLAGLPPQAALGTNKGGAMFGAAAATLRFAASKKIDYAAAIPAALLAFPGSYIGAWIQMQLPATAVRVIIMALLPLAAIPILRNRDLAPRRTLSVSRPVRLALCGAVGFVIGMYDGFFGPGTGTFLIIALVFVCGMEVVMASGTAKVINLSSNVAAAVAFALGGQVMWHLALPAALLAIAGSTLGAHMAIRKGIGLIKPVILLVLSLLTIRLMYDVVTALI